MNLDILSNLTTKLKKFVQRKDDHIYGLALAGDLPQVKSRLFSYNDLHHHEC
jgi:hypothetical protein